MLERYVLADRLGKFKYEIDQMPASELLEWRQYFVEIGQGK